jgi:hypothetical protein
LQGFAGLNFADQGFGHPTPGKSNASKRAASNGTGAAPSALANSAEWEELGQ